MNSTFTHKKIIIVGAGPGGLAVGAALKDKGIDDILLLERGVVGQAWLDYPSETKLLSESSEQKDDNMIAGVHTAEVLPNVPHPSHISYQKYLQHIVVAKKLPVQEHSQVTSVQFNPEQKVFVVMTKAGEQFTCNYLIWSAGMYLTPQENMECEGCYMHYSRMPYLGDITSPEVTVIGSGNGASGVILLLAKPGRVVTLITTKKYEVPLPIDCLWKEQMQLIQHLEKQGLVKIIEDFRVKRIIKNDATEHEEYIIESEDGRKLTAAKKPITCTGFLFNIDPVKHFVEEKVQGHDHLLDLTPSHESQKQSGLYFGGTVGKQDSEEGFIRHFTAYGEEIAQDISNKLHLK